MKINSLFNEAQDVNIHSYLEKCGIMNVDAYLTGQVVEPYTNYDNIEDCAKGVIEWLNDNNTLHQICDCDFDGETSSAMLYSYLKLINPNIEIITHFHSDKSHGLSKETFNEIKKYVPSLLLIADASTNDSDECKKLSKLNWKIQIYDHHHKEKENPYALIVNNQTSKNVENKGLCGTGVTFKVMQAIDKQLNVNYSKHFISYVWLANVSDSVPFTHPEQYTFAKWGRKMIHPNLQPFVDAWCEDLDNRTIAWQLTPKFNSAIRLGTLEDKQQLFQALCGEIDPTDIIAKCKSYHTQQSNQSRKMVEDVEIVNNSSIVIGRLHEKTTMTGLIAGKLMSKYGKPVLLGHANESSGEFSGSVRSPIDFKDVLKDSGLTSFQSGHDKACGFGYPLSNEQAIIDYLDSVIVDCEPSVDVLTSCSIKCLPNSLFSFKMDYRHLFAKNMDIVGVHIPPFTIYNTDIKVMGKTDGAFSFEKDGLKFLLFVRSNDDKAIVREKFYLDCEDKVKLNIETIVELQINEYTSPKNGKTYINNQAIIQEFECSKVDDNEIKWEEIW